jgi:hypothetical protein
VIVGLACVTTLVAWIWLAVAMSAHPSPPRDMKFVMPGAAPRAGVLGYGTEILQGERFWRLCDYGSSDGHVQRGMCRYDAASGTAEMSWPLPNSSDEAPWAVAAEPSGALVMVTSRSVLRLKPAGGVDALGGPVGFPKGLKVAPRLEVVTVANHGAELHALEAGKWTTTAIPAPTPPDEDTTDVHLEVAIPRPDGWDLAWSTPKQVFAAPVAAPPHTLGAVPAGSTKPGSLVDPVVGGVIVPLQYPLVLAGDKVVAAPPGPSGSVWWQPAYVLGANGLEALPRRSFEDLRRTTSIAHAAYTILLLAGHGFAAGPDGAPGPASVSSTGAFDPWLIPLGTRWLLVSNTGQYAILDSSFARTDAQGPYERVARVFTNYDHKLDLDMTTHVWKALALPIALGGLLALCLVLVGFTAILRRGAGVALVIASALYLIACGVCAQNFFELTNIL